MGRTWLGYPAAEIRVKNTNVFEGVVRYRKIPWRSDPPRRTCSDDAIGNNFPLLHPLFVMESRPLVSVIIPVYNGNRHLGACLDAV